MFFLVLTVPSCQKDEIVGALESLDKVIQKNEQWQNCLNARVDSLRAVFEDTAPDAGRWRLSKDLYMAYYHHSLDSSMVYLKYMKRYASTSEEILLTQMKDMELRLVRMNEMEALDEYLALDRSSLDEDMLMKYLSEGITMYHQLYKHDVAASGRSPHKAALQTLRKEYLSLDSTSVLASKIKAHYERENGDTEAALEIFRNLYDRASDYQTKASVAYNIATLYGMKEECATERIIWLATSAENDFKAAGRDYLSLYELAIMLYDRQMYIEANRYVELNLADSFAGNFNSRYINAGKTHVMINEAERDSADKRMRLMTGIVCILVVFIVMILFLLQYSMHKRKKLKESRQILQKMNCKLVEVNHDLADANKIKDSYVFRYMELSLQYLKKRDDYKRRLNNVYKTKGIDAVVKLFRSPSDTYKEYNDYYKVFDEIFLGLYPDFVNKVNGLLKEEARFPLPVNNKLCTELRMLAAIRIGITESGKISTFLNCSPTTIYTYRTRIHRAALHSKEEFEDLIRNL